MLPALSGLALSTDGVKRDRNHVAIHASQFVEDYEQVISHLIKNGVIRIQRGEFRLPGPTELITYTYAMNFHTLKHNNRDALSSIGFASEAQADAVRQAMQQPPFYFRYVVGEQKWFSQVSSFEGWVHAAMSERYEYVESMLIRYLEDLGKPLHDDGGDYEFKALIKNNRVYILFTPTYLNDREEMKQMILKEPYSFKEVEFVLTEYPDGRKRNDRYSTHYVFEHVPIFNQPLPENFENAVKKHVAQITQRNADAARYREQVRKEEADAERNREQRREQVRKEEADAERNRRQQIENENNLRAQLERDALESRRLQDAQWEERRQARVADDARRKQILKDFVKDGKVPEADSRWYDQTFKDSIEEAASMAVLEQYESILKEVDARGGGPARKIGLQYYRMVPIAQAIWSVVHDMQDQIVAEYASLGLHPVMDARPGGKTVHVRAKLRLPIPSESIGIFVRTTPSAAEAHMKTNRIPTNEFAAISWSLEFEKDSIERQVVNERLRDPERGPGYKQTSEGAQVQVRSSASLNAALNALWEDVFTEEEKAKAHTWSENMDPEHDVSNAKAVVSDAPPPRPPPTPTPTPTPSTPQTEFRTMKRANK